MKFCRMSWAFASIVAILNIGTATTSRAAQQVIVATSALNELVTPIWVGMERGSFKNYGVEVGLLLIRSGPVSMAALASGAYQVMWPAPSSVLSAASGGLKVSCVASFMNKIPRELIVRKEIKSFDDLRGRVFGVQSIGGGFWFMTMFVLEDLGIDPDKYQLKMRVVGDTATVTQALMTGVVDAAVLPYSYSEMVKREGFRSLADTGQLKASYQGSSLCFQRDFMINSPTLVMQLLKGVLEAVVFIHDPSNKKDVMEILKKNLRLAKLEDIETSYKVLRLMTTLDVALDLPAWRTTQRIVARVNPRAGQVDLKEVLEGSFVRNLEESGFLPEMRKKIRR